MRRPKERLPERGFSAEYFPQFHGGRQPADFVHAIPPPHKKPDPAACDVSRKWHALRAANAMPPVCPWFVATLPQDV
jgi:hypothetical protein